MISSVLDKNGMISEEKTMALINQIESS